MSLNPTYSREKFLEAHDLIIQAWTRPGPFRFEGKHYRFRNVNVWPRPIQKPHPRIWIPSQGSAESIEWAAERHYPLMLVYSAVDTVQMRFDQYRAAAQALGYTASPAQLGWMVPTYLAETEARAMQAAEEHILWLFHKGLKMPQHYFFPPGYLSERSQLAVGGRKLFSEYSFRDFVDEGWVLVGDPASVADQIKDRASRLGCGVFLGLFQIATMNHWETVRNIELFAREVMPKIRSAASAVPLPEAVPA
jgi:alkanesulfonate monooxygenase SsuD/methylene tetrahydromethanopterin reductase-like flavin-dependent oxidoreductase (luciferase family)